MLIHNPRLELENFWERFGTPQLFYDIDNIHTELYFFTENENIEYTFQINSHKYVFFRTDFVQDFLKIWDISDRFWTGSEAKPV